MNVRRVSRRIFRFLSVLRYIIVIIWRSLLVPHVYQPPCQGPARQAARRKCPRLNELRSGLPASGVGRVGRVWCRINIAVLIPLLTLPTLGLQPALGQGAPAAVDAALAQPLQPSQAVQAHRQVEGWVRVGAVDRATLEPVTVTDATAVRVTLRMDGFLLGVGDAYGSNLATAVSTPGPAINLTPLVADAAERAIAEFGRNLRDAKTRAVTEGRIPGDRPSASITDVGDRVLVDLQIARHFEPIRVPSDAKPGAVLGAFAPGHHGLRTPGVDTSAPGSWVWPGTALALNTTPRGQFLQLIGDQGLEVSKVDMLGKPIGPPVQRFEVFHVVRPAPGRAPVLLTRGNLLLPALAVSSRALANLADALAAHLSRRFVEEGVRGTYLPSRDEYDAAWAKDEEAGLACYALLRHSRQRRAAQPNDRVAPEHAARAIKHALRLLEPGEGGSIGTNPGGAALALLTLCDAEDAEVPEPARRDAAARYLLGLRGEKGGYHEPGKPEAMLSEAAQALVTASLAAYYDRTRDASTGAAVRASLDELWTASEGSPNIAVLPWFVVAQSRAGRLLAGDAPEAQAAIKAREQTLGDLVDRLCKQQVIEPPLLGPADVVGGFELTRGPAGSPPNPDWRTAQLLSFLAVALSQEGAVEGHNAFDWAITGGLAARFIAQLSMDENAAFYARSPAATVGGVRLSLGDNRLAVSATAMSLLAVTQLQEAMGAVEAGFGP